MNYNKKSLTNARIDKLRKGFIPVIAAVILVAVAITVSVALSYWMCG